MVKNAIVLLARGWDDLRKYSNLIKRNQAIAMTLYNKWTNDVKLNTDIIIFHEGNITRDQQEFIQSRTPRMPLCFIEVAFISSEEADRRGNGTKWMHKCHSTQLSNAFTNGYKNMCYFWSVSFFDYLKDYEYVMRVDDDCILNKIPANIFETYKRENIVYASPSFQCGDDDGVTLGLQTFFQLMMMERSLSPLTVPNTQNIMCPYTNVFVINMPYFLQSFDIIDMCNKLTQCGCNFRNRWGDLPIHGYMLHCFVPREMYKEDKNISYYHGSHQSKVNM